MHFVGETGGKSPVYSTSTNDAGEDKTGRASVLASLNNRLPALFRVFNVLCLRCGERSLSGHYNSRGGDWAGWRRGLCLLFQYLYLLFYLCVILFLN